ncbi:DUF3360 family protein [Mobilitalea sibirica]|uniref:DUF3360 family protein n=1 Tax=Mobilitalea sibirica TaxID=1462919 RepID=A0A8J7L070_9FIRM|nr:DUF3360 family protein [Mobilitalea sibirica]MBH1941763.1 DUF3360 family protein [Mobilitalea sibirica]
MSTRQVNPNRIRPIDLIPALSGLIGKIALVSSFAVVWAQVLNITTPDFVFKNVQIELIIGSAVSLIAALLLPNMSPAGTLAPLVVLIPAMAGYGVHPFVLSILVGIVGIISIKTRLFHVLISLSGIISKTSITMTFGISGIMLSLKNLQSFFGDNMAPLFIMIGISLISFLILMRKNITWLIIPISAAVSIVLPLIFGFSIDYAVTTTLPNFNPSYWWYEVWGVGFGFDIRTILVTLPFAFFAILLWAIDTVSVQAMIDANYKEDEAKEEIDLDRSFILAALRNMIGGTFGGAQTAALWRSFLIPLFMVKRPVRYSSILLGILGIIAGFSAVPIKVLSFPPLIWSVLLFGIFLPFINVGIRNIINAKSNVNRISIVIFTTLGVVFTPILTWVGAVVFEKTQKRFLKNKD